MEIPVSNGSLDNQLKDLFGRANAAGRDNHESSYQSLKQKNTFGSNNGSEMKSKRAKPDSDLGHDVLRELLGQRGFDKLIQSERFRGYKNKNQLTINPLKPEEVEFYRSQEAARYKYPQKPWVYLSHDGTTNIVGPVVKKNKNGDKISFHNKPRDHP